MNYYKSLSQEQQILYSAMMMPEDRLPIFPSSTEVINLGLQIHNLYKRKILTKMFLDEHGNIHCS
jgi:hypothetical protein